MNFSHSGYLSKQAVALLSILSLLLSAFPAGFFVAIADTTGVITDRATATTPVDVPVFFKVSTQFEGDTTLGTEIVLSDGGNSGVFYDANNTTEVCGSLDTDGRFAINQNKGVCYSNNVAGVYTILIQLVDDADTVIGEANVEITVTEVTEPPLEPEQSEMMVLICKATASEENLYVAQEVNANSFANGHGEGGVNAEDIIPPTEPHYPNGQNWDDEGQAIYNNDCAVPTVTPEPEPVTVCEPLIEAWFTDTVELDQGLQKNGSAVAEQRSNPTSVTGPADWSPGGSAGFVSLGFGGEIVFSFGNFVVDVAGTDVTIYEATNGAGTYPPEAADVYISQDNSTWFKVGTAGTLESEFDIAPSGLSWFTYLKLVDVSDPTLHTGSADGFDLDAVQVSRFECDQPADPELVATIVATKVICTDEADLPNFSATGKGGPNITSTTATDWVAAHASCRVAPEWEFEWAPKNTSNPGDALVGPAGGAWTTFGLTNELGVATVTIPESVIAGDSFVWVREVLKEGYIPFTFGSQKKKNTDNVTAEMYCHTDVLNYDNYDRVDGITGGATYYCVAWNAPAVVDLTATVSLCKYGDEEVPLPEWQLALLGEKVAEIDVLPDGTDYWLENIPAGQYVLQASGEYTYRNGGLTADAAFSKRQAGDPGFGTFPFNPWRATNPATEHLGLRVNGDALGWGTVFAANHEYYQSFIQSETGDIAFSITDDAYGDNRGMLTASLYHGVTGVTNENGCVVFEAVPYGAYEVAELLPPGWEVVSGTGSVLVDETTETFTVVNHDLSFIPPCELTVVSDTTTLVAETNEYAAEAYEHRNWTAEILGATWIWVTEFVQKPREDEIYTFIDTFTVDSPAVAQLTIAADNGYRVEINGVVVPELDRLDQSNFRNFQLKSDIDVLSYLNPTGENTLRITVKNFALAGSNAIGNPAGLLYRLDVSGANNCAVTTTPEREDEPDPELPQRTISGVKWLDADENGLRDELEAGVRDWVITITNGVDTATTSTNEDGEYEFVVPIGNWVVSEEVREGWIQTGVVADRGEVVGDTCEFSLTELTPEEELLEAIFGGASCDFGNYQLPIEEEDQLDEEETDINPDPQTPDTSNDTNDDTVSTNSSGGNGGGFFRSQVGTLQLGAAPARVAGVSTSCQMYLTEYLRLGLANTPFEVIKLQLFLNWYGITTPITGVFDAATDASVREFQRRHTADVLTPWFTAGIVTNENPTGYVYKTTRWKINDMVCPGLEPFPKLTE